MDDTASDYHHGQQNVADQAATYRLFGALTKWGALHLAVLIIVLTLWFCTGAGFLGGLIAGLVVLAAGIVFLRSKRPEGH
jgi:thiamine transporter ThiT